MALDLTLFRFLQVIDSRKRAVIKRAQAAAQHHNIHIDASSSGTGGVGGIHNSTVNINLNQSGGAKKRSRSARRKVDLGDHSVIVDVSTSGENSTAGGIEDSTVHVNILPARALNKATGHHSIVVDSSSLSSTDESSTTTGSHSAVVDTSSSSSSSTDASSSTGVKNSTINLTVISPKDEPAAAAADPASPASDAVDAPTPTMAHLSARARAAYDEWAARMRERDYPAGSGAAPATGFVQRRRGSSHASKRSTVVVEA